MKALNSLLLMVFSSLFLLFGCAESAVETAWEISGDTKDAAARSAAAGTEQAIVGDSAGFAGFGSLSADIRSLLEDQAFATRATGLSTRETYTQACDSGSVTVSTNNSTSATVTYNNCTYNEGGYSTTFNGSASFTSSSDGSFTYDYDITATYGGQTYSVTGTFSCDSQGNCNYSDEFSANGVSYRIENATVTSSYNGYDVSFRIYHDEFGYIDVEGNDLVQCSDGGFSDGEITVTDGSGSDVLFILFNSNDCTTMEVTFNSNTQTINQ